jgi:hypothetical protein
MGMLTAKRGWGWVMGVCAFLANISGLDLAPYNVSTISFIKLMFIIYP